MNSESIGRNDTPVVTAFLDDNSNTFSYVVADPSSGKCAVIDPVLDFDYASGSTQTTSIDAIVDFLREQDLTPQWIIETHVHADHLSAAPAIKRALGGSIGIGNRIDKVQQTFKEIFNESEDFPTDGSQFDHLFYDNESYRVGNIEAHALCTPGHTPACMTHVIGDAAFVGDTLFMPDGGTARADFPGGDASVLYDSIDRILALPDDTRIFVCHDYAPGGREFRHQTSVAEQRDRNIHVGGGRKKSDFVQLRENRDAGLSMPQLIIPSIQVNMRAGWMPRDRDGREMLKVPVNKFG